MAILFKGFTKYGTFPKYVTIFGNQKIQSGNSDQVMFDVDLRTEYFRILSSSHMIWPLTAAAVVDLLSPSLGQMVL